MIDFPDVEFHREGYGMLAAPQDKDPGAPVCFPRTPGGKILTGNCTCSKSRLGGASCPHLSRLISIAKEVRRKYNGSSPAQTFAASTWFRLAVLLSEGDPVPCEGVKAGQLERPAGMVFVFTRFNGGLLARLPDPSAASLRFAERIGQLPGQKFQPSRADLIQKLAGYQRTPEEQQLNKAGMLTRRQAAEQSFWGRLAYHAFREYGDACRFQPTIDLQTGDFILTCVAEGNQPVAEIAVPRLRVRKLLAFLAAEFPGEPGLAIRPIPLKSIFLITEKTKIDLEVRPVIQALQVSGESSFLERDDFEKFRYGDLIYIKDMNVMAELERADAERRFASPVSMNLKKSQLPSFIQQHEKEIKTGEVVMEGTLRELSIYRDFDRIEISLDALERSWYWLSVRYGIGDRTYSLAEILQARKEGKAYLEAQGGWIDLHSEAFRILDSIEQQERPSKKGRKGIAVSAVNLLRMLSSAEKPVRIGNEEDEKSKILRRILDLSPATPWTKVKGLATPLRPYQIRGVDWLRFLFDNELGGLLCDDMGLGKTHQAMALMVWLKEKRKISEPFLVVCPTTVISHWVNKIRDHAPGLNAIPYHTANRSIAKKLKPGSVLLTSYGILRNDILTLKKIPFGLVVFDEVQNLKNRETQSYQAASLLRARMSLGLTGTPIENSLLELKALFDLVLPGYLGADQEFAARYAEELRGNPGTELAHLKKTISPFTLRRLKRDVLEDLPEKFEDLRTCQLSDMQVGLYREALSTKGASLLSTLQSDTRQLPYIHIFALLNFLKRICDHPALALNKIDDYESYQSGKWDLFRELLLETLDSGQKIVVFTQYLGMIRIMEKLLQTLGTEFVTLTGSSQDRGEIVSRFNNDPDCRVFLGSLKAGGTGIDLVGGSTVLHYDRWWNAAREDQATDRVHRIGQKRAVQVIKLITEGTLEEKISAIIDRKRLLMNTVVQEDDPHLGKIFSREELIELLKPV